MDLDEYRQRGKEMVDYIANYLDTIRSRRVFPKVSPGYMRDLIPDSAPDVGEKWMDIFSDIERVIMPGITHWQSPHMHAYFPALNSFPSLLGDMLADAIGCLGFTWASSPACTELETIVMDWLGKMIGLPPEFLHSNEQTMGGGVIQTTASESTFVSLLAARSMAMKQYKMNDPDLEDAEINARLVAYCSDQAHSSVEKAGLIGLVKLRLLPCDEELSLRGKTLREAIDRDRQEGLIPFFLCATLGTTGACAFDHLQELGPICKAENVWMHIDAAYAGTAFICPEFRHFLQGVEYAQSFAFNPSKWMMVHFDCTAMWVKNSGALHRTFNVQPLYLQHENTGAAIDYMPFCVIERMHWQVPLSRRFRALKLWFVIRNYGVTGLQKHVRRGVQLAKRFEELILMDNNFEIPAKRHLGMVVFRLKGDNNLTELLLKRLNSSGRVHMVPAAFRGKYVIRFTVTSSSTTEADIERDWAIIQREARRVLTDQDSEEEEEEAVPVVDNKVHLQDNISAVGQMRKESMRRREFGMSLILSNVPMSPKFINGSFAALFDTNDIIIEYARQLSRRSMDLNGRPIRLSPRKRLKEHAKQYSLDLAIIPTRRSLHSFKQGSLDSKIEEIFDSSFESDLYDTDNDVEPEVNWKPILVRANSPKAGLKRQEKAIILSPNSPEYLDLAVDSTPSVAVNGMVPHLKCKHCGHLIED